MKPSGTGWSGVRQANELKRTLALRGCANRGNLPSSIFSCSASKTRDCPIAFRAYVRVLQNLHAAFGLSCEDQGDTTQRQFDVCIFRVTVASNFALNHIVHLNSQTTTPSHVILNLARTLHAADAERPDTDRKPG